MAGRPAIFPFLSVYQVAHAQSQCKGTGKERRGFKRVDATPPCNYVTQGVIAEVAGSRGVCLSLSSPGVY